jgi:L-amino acid N-acyltransferase YncA
MEPRAAAVVAKPRGCAARMSAGFTVRAATTADVPAITAIYADSVRTGTATYEYAAPETDEMRRRFEAIVGTGYPYLVATDTDGDVLGYAYACVYRPRPGYRYTVEDSVYVATNAARRGIGRALLSTLISTCTARGDRLMIAVLGDTANVATVALHRALGFEIAGRLPGVGWKFGRWLDGLLMCLALGDGRTSPPSSG